MSWLRLPEPPPQEEVRALVLRDGRTVAVRWVRDGRARRLRLIVGERGARLTVPRTASIGLAERFLFEHRDWLATQLDKRPPVDATPFSAARDRELPLRGERVPIAWSEGRYLRIALDENGVPRFELLQGRINLQRSNDVAHMDATRPVGYFIFDRLRDSFAEEV